MRVSTRVKLIKPFKLGPNAHQRIENYVRRIFERESRKLASVDLSIESTLVNDQRMITCQILLALRTGGLITVEDFGDTIHTAVQQASLRARQVVRRRLHKTRSLARRSSHRYDESLLELSA